MAKHFLITPEKQKLDRKDILDIEKESQKKLNNSKLSTEQIAEQVLHEEDTLIHTEGRVIVKINIQGKNYHRFDNGMQIRRERQFNNLNFRETSPVNCIVISGNGLPKDAEILVDYHSIHDSYRIFDYKNKSPYIRYYSIKQEDCYLWLDENKIWQPLNPYELALRVFKKYEGVISWMKPEVLDNILYVTTGDLKGKIIHTLLGCDYQCVFQDTNGKEGNRIRFLPFGNPKVNKEEEAILIRHDLMEELEKETLLLGYTLSDCKTLKEYQDA